MSALPQRSHIGFRRGMPVIITIKLNQFRNDIVSSCFAKSQQLLDQNQFSEITKIKTIGSTYMAASGLNITDTMKVTNQLTNPTSWKLISSLMSYGWPGRSRFAEPVETSFASR